MAYATEAYAGVMHADYCRFERSQPVLQQVLLGHSNKTADKTELQHQAVDEFILEEKFPRLDGGLWSLLVHRDATYNQLVECAPLLSREQVACHFAYYDLDFDVSPYEFGLVVRSPQLVDVGYDVPLVARVRGPFVDFGDQFAVDCVFIPAEGEAVIAPDLSTVAAGDSRGHSLAQVLGQLGRGDNILLFRSGAQSLPSDATRFGSAVVPALPGGPVGAGGSAGTVFAETGVEIEGGPPAVTTGPSVEPAVARPVDDGGDDEIQHPPACPTTEEMAADEYQVCTYPVSEVEREDGCPVQRLGLRGCRGHATPAMDNDECFSPAPPGSPPWTVVGQYTTNENVEKTGGGKFTNPLGEASYSYATSSGVAVTRNVFNEPGANGTGVCVRVYTVVSACTWGFNILSDLVVHRVQPQEGVFFGQLRPWSDLVVTTVYPCRSSRIVQHVCQTDSANVPVTCSRE
ncbi:MAG: hypothetical protein AAFU73_15780 [Planctomycetota bacterium]